MHGVASARYVVTCCFVLLLCVYRIMMDRCNECAMISTVVLLLSIGGALGWLQRLYVACGVGVSTTTSLHDVKDDFLLTHTNVIPR